MLLFVVYWLNRDYIVGTLGFMGLDTARQITMLYNIPS